MVGMCVLVCFALIPFACFYGLGVMRRRAFADSRLGQRAARRATGLCVGCFLLLTALATTPGNHAHRGSAPDIGEGARLLFLAFCGISSVGAGLAWVCFLGAPPAQGKEPDGIGLSRD